MEAHRRYSQLTGLPPVPASAPDGRQFVRDTLTRWGMGHLLDAALLCTSELVTNAVLHAGTLVDILITADPRKVRIAIVDANPAAAFRAQTLLALSDSSPADTGTEPSALTTGRGMLIVAWLADALGEAMTAEGKTVWFDLRLDRDPLHATGGGVVLKERPTPPPAAIDGAVIELVGVPAGTAVALAQYIDGMVREAQLDDSAPHARDVLTSLRDVTDAFPHLDGLFDAARIAVARRHTRFDAGLAVDRRRTDAAGRVTELIACLDVLAASGTAPIPVAAHELGHWIAAEVAAQLDGAAATACPLLPSDRLRTAGDL